MTAINTIDTSASNGGTTILKIYDKKNDMRRTIYVSKKEADEFISQRKKAKENAKTRGGILTIAGGFLGGMFGYHSNLKDTLATTLAFSLLGALIGVTLYHITGNQDASVRKVNEKFLKQHQD